MGMNRTNCWRWLGLLSWRREIRSSLDVPSDNGKNAMDKKRARIERQFHFVSPLSRLSSWMGRLSGDIKRDWTGRGGDKRPETHLWLRLDLGWWSQWLCLDHSCRSSRVQLGSFLPSYIRHFGYHLQVWCSLFHCCPWFEIGFPGPRFGKLRFQRIQWLRQKQRHCWPWRR